jgi:hypothetical protein
MFDVLKWHDGSPFSAGFIVAGQISAGAGKPESSVYMRPVRSSAAQARFKREKILDGSLDSRMVR